MDAFLDKFFIIFHTLYALFCLIGWIWRKTRKLNLLLLLLTLFSWIVLGIWYGIGYCPLTDWHWQVRSNLKMYDMPDSYIKFLFDTLSFLDWHATVVDIMTGVGFGLAFIVSAILNIKDWKKKR